MKNTAHRILISGAGSGLGKFLVENISGAVPFTRETNYSAIQLRAADCPFDAIIHAAANSKADPALDYAAYINDNILLTERLIQLPHKQFIFCSTVDVYKTNKVTNELYKETNELLLDEAVSWYAKSKLFSELLVLKKAENPVVLRLSALLGPYIKKNNLIRLLTEENPCLSLTETSAFNYILYQDVIDFIKVALQQKIAGVFNLAAKGNITLGEIAMRWGKAPVFGSHDYQTGLISSEKAEALCAVFSKCSLDNLKAFIQVDCSVNAL